MNTYLSDIDDKKIYRSLSEALASRSLILFAGSGLSAQALSPDGKRPPLWKPLLEGMIKWCKREHLLNNAAAKEIQKLIDHGFLIDAGQEIQEILYEPTQLQRCIFEKILYTTAMSGEAHKLITKLPFRGYLTTNYDEFIEGEFRNQHGIPLKKYYKPTLEGVLETYRNYEQFIVKLHGDINDPSSIVLGNRSYEALLNNNQTYRQCLETIFSMSSILFIGFSGSDPDIESIISRVAAFDGNYRRHHMLVTKGSVPNLKAKRFWKDKGINIIEYSEDKSHSEVVRFLNNLLKSYLDTQLAPSYDTKVSAKIERKR